MSIFTREQPPLFPFDAGSVNEAGYLKLRNGVNVYLIEGGTEDVMRIEFTFRAGQVHECIPLLSSSTNMMLTEGTVNYSAEEINKILDFYGIFLNPYNDKDTAGIVIYFLNKHIGKALEFSHEILFSPVFPEKELSVLMKKRLRWFQVSREKVQTLASDQLLESIFGSNHPYGMQVKEADFESISPTLLKDFHSRYYNPENMTIIVSGKLHPDTATLLDNYFGGIDSKMAFTEESGIFLKGGDRKKIVIDKPGAVQSSIRIGSATVNKRHPDYTGLKVMNSILGGYFGSRLMKNIREEKGYTYGIHSVISSLDLSGFKVITTEVANRNTRETIDEIYKEIRLLQTEPVKKDELEVVRNYMSGEMVRMFDGPFAMADSFKAAWEFGLDMSYYHRLAEKIKTITSDEIMQLALTYYNIDELYEVIAG